MTPKVLTLDTNKRTHRAVLDDAQLRHQLAKVIADQMGVDLNAPHVSCSVYIRNVASSLDTHPNRMQAEIEIVEDFGPAGE